MTSTQIVAYGRPATGALSAEVAAAKQASPLAPVTVVVASNFVGLSVRRLLGGGTLDGTEAAGLSGIANVQFVTPFRLAELVAADLLLDTQPITNPVLGAAVRQVLVDDPGWYGPVADHESTEAALARLFAELSNVDEAGLESITDQGSRAAMLAVQFYRAIADQLPGFHTEHDLATAAAGRSDLAAQLERFGHVVWYLPAPVTPAIGGFLSEVLRCAPSSTVIAAMTGVESADVGVWRAFDSGNVSPPAVDVEPAAAASIVSVTDAPEEVREVCRRIVALVAEGVRLDRIGVFFPTPDPYVRIIEQQFAGAGIPINGPNPRRLADSVAGRVLLGALDLSSVRWRRDSVMALLSDGPLRFGDDMVRPAVWDDVSRSAGVVQDHADWRRKIEHRRTKLEDRIDELRAGPPDDHAAFQLRRLEDEIADGANLVEFLDQLRTLTTAVERADEWPDKCAAATALLRALLGEERTHGSWPDEEQAAFTRVEDALMRLALLADIEPGPKHGVFLRALRSELDVARGRTGRFGHGVVYGPITTAVGLDLDAVFVVGCAEGLMPMHRRDDAILPDAVRQCSLDQLDVHADQLRHQHRAFLAVLAAAPAERRTLTFPRGDLRSNRGHLPSRWLLDTATALNGAPVVATDFDELDAAVVDKVGSFASGISVGEQGSIGERDLVALRVEVDNGAVAAEHGLAALVGRGFDAQAARASHDLTAFDGNLGEQVGAVEHALPGLGARALSPSRLETWASCGFKYFLNHVLDVSERDDPERTDELSALDRGSLIHAALEQFVGEAISDGLPKPSETWSPAARLRLHEIADELSDGYASAGRTGRRANWRVQRDDLHDLLDAFLAADDAFRAGATATPTAVELDLGVRSGQTVPVTLPNGETIQLRGMIDRVDLDSAGRVLVNDYKSGKGAKYDKLGDDPFLAGTTLQLGMYAEGAMQMTGAAEASTHYWLVERDGGTRLGYRWTDELRARFHEVLEAITSGIASGVFAASPGEWDMFRQTNENCAYCDFDSVCVRDRGDHEQAKSAAPELAVRVALTPNADVADGEAGS